VLLASGSNGEGVAIGQALNGIGCHVKIVPANSDLLQSVKRWSPALIVLGAGSKPPRQVTLLRRLRTDRRTRRVPILTILESRLVSKAWALTDEVVRRPVASRELAIRVRALLRLEKLAHDSRRTLRRVRKQARIDSLTRLATHGAFKERLTRELHRAYRYRRMLSVLMADLDHFKHYNDNFGHPAGDRLLRLVARMVQSQVRQVDFGARYGGDEFSIILPETSKGAAGAMAERLRAAIESYPFPHHVAQPLGKVTVSIGVATFPEDATTEEKLLDAADRALYQAKADGRNLVRGMVPSLSGDPGDPK